MKYFVLEIDLDNYEPIIYDINHVATFEIRENAEAFILSITSEIDNHNVNRINKINEYVENIYIPSKFPEEYEDAKAFCLDWFDQEHINYYSSIRNNIKERLIKGYGLGKNKQFLYNFFPERKPKRDLYILEVV